MTPKQEAAYKLAVQVAVVQLYDQHPADTEAAFSLSELTEIVEATNPARIEQSTVEGIYRAALYPK